MSLSLAFKAFFKALKKPELARQFLEEKEVKKISSEHSHLKMLSMLQQAGRLIDFLKEDISNYNDAEVGSAVRKIHSDCAKLIEEIVTIRPLLETEEGKEIEIPPGFDPQKFKLLGKIKGEPPFKGIVLHKGWKAHKHSLPQKGRDNQNEIIYSAEIEIR